MPLFSGNKMKGKIMQRIKTTICILLLCVITFSFAENVQAEFYTGSAGGNIVYTVDTEKNVITVEGKSTFGEYYFLVHRMATGNFAVRTG